MKLFRMSLLPTIAAGLGLAALGYALFAESDAFGKAVMEWARRDLAARTELAVQALDGALADGDFRRLREFADDCRHEGLRLTILSTPGGMIYDSCARAHGDHGDRPEIIAARKHGVATVFRHSQTTGSKSLMCARQTNHGFIRLALPEARVFEAVGRSRKTVILSALVGVCAFLFIFLFIERLLARFRALARAHEAQERRLAELKRQEEFRRAFVSDVTHEIKTPLTGILTAAELLADGEDGSRAPVLAMLRKEAGRLNELVQDVLSLAKLEHDEALAERDFAPAELSGIVDETLARMRPRAELAGIRLSGETENIVADCNARLISQALDNLVTNALFYGNSPTVAITLKREGDKACFTVVDHGEGIAAEHRAHVFERFYRVDKSRSRAHGGTGLGLAIVKHVALVHGGEATVEETPGGGATFAFTIDLHQINKKTNNH